MDNNILIVDLETTGLLPEKHEIIEIGCVNTSNGDTFEVKVHPLHIKEAQPEALKVNGYNEKDWEDAFLLPNALCLLSDFIGSNRPMMMAYNISFDRAFLEKAYKDCGMVYPFHYHHLDLLTLTWYKLRTRPGDGAQGLSLRNVCYLLDIPPEPLIHRAGTGAQKAFEVYKTLTKGV